MNLPCLPSPDLAAQDVAVAPPHLLPVSTTALLIEDLLPSPNNIHVPTHSHIHTHTPMHPHTLTPPHILTQAITILYPDLPLLVDELVPVDHLSGAHTPAGDKLVSCPPPSPSHTCIYLSLLFSSPSQCKCDL